MILSSACPPRPADQPGQRRKYVALPSLSYTTTGDVTTAQLYEKILSGDLTRHKALILRRLFHAFPKVDASGTGRFVVKAPSAIIFKGFFEMQKST